MSEQGWREFLAADDVDDWAILHGGPTAVFKVASLAEAARLAAAVADVPGLEARTLLTAASDRLTVKLTREMWGTEARHVDVARAISAVAREYGATPDRSAVQEVQVAVAAKPDAIDLPFWRAVLGYAPLHEDNCIDPNGQGSTVWMQDLDPNKPLRHAMHIDVSVARDHAGARMQAAVAAGGTVVDASSAPGAWILADRSGNKVCIASWPDGAPTLEGDQSAPELTMTNRPDEVGQQDDVDVYRSLKEAPRRLRSVAPFAVSQLTDIAELVDAGTPFRPIRLHFGISSFGATCWAARAAGDTLINAHDEQDVGDEELFLVLHGKATFQLDGTRVDAPAGTLVHCRPGTSRTAVADDAGTTVLALDGKPGQIYEPRGWELWTGLAPLYTAGRHREVAERLRGIVAKHPEYPVLFFNLACAESLLGESTPALDHLRQAIELNDEFRQYALDDADLASLRDDPRFVQLMAG